MYISKIKIENYRNYDFFEVDLKPFTVLIGENNIGKSNIVNAIGLVLSNEISFFKSRSLEIEDIHYQSIQKFKKDVFCEEIENIEFPEVKVELYFSDFFDTNEQLAIVSDWLIDDLKTAKLSYIYRNSNPKSNEWLKEIKEKIKNMCFEDAIKNINLPIEDYSYVIFGGDSEKKADSYFLKKIGMEILDALRDAKSELSTEGRRNLLYKILVNRDLENYSEIITSIENLHNSINNQSGEIGKIKDNIEEYLNKVSLETENSSNKVNFRFTSLEITEILKKFGLEYGGSSISIDRNGLGRNNLLFISLILSHLLSLKKNNYFKLIVVEEPEAHLSPVLQKHLARNIEQEDENRQVIITSHSTHITSHLNIDNTLVIYKDNNEIKSHYLLDNIKTKYKKYLKKWLNATNSTMFFTRRLILVEGIAEQILIPTLFKRYTGESLEKFNCQIINVNGVAFNNFLEVIKNGYFIKCAVLTDSDEGTKTEDRAENLQLKYENDQIKVFITRKTQTFETEILEFNKSGKGRTTINNAMKETRPKLYGENSTKKCTNKNIDVNLYFEDIENYKSAFAFELSSYLEEKGDKSGFKIPKYIEDAFDFIIKSGDENA